MSRKAFTLFELLILLALCSLLLFVLITLISFEKSQSSRREQRQQTIEQVRSQIPYPPREISPTVLKFPATHTTGVNVFEESLAAWQRQNPKAEIVSISPDEGDEGDDTWVLYKLVVVRPLAK